MKVFKKITIVSILLIIMLTYIQTLVFAAESELTLTPKPETRSTKNRTTRVTVNTGYICNIFRSELVRLYLNQHF